MTDAGTLFIASCRGRVADLGARARAALQRLDDADLAWRPDEGSNAVGNLVLHLEGNLRQRVLSLLAGAPDTRDRDAEFNARGPFRRDELLRRWDAVLTEVDAALAALTPARLGERVRVGDREPTVLELLLSVVTHMAEHVGQVVYIAKLRLGPGWEPLSPPHRRG